MNCEDLLQEHLKDHTYNLQQENGLLIDQQYADDTCWVAVNAKHSTEKIMERVPAQLNKKNFHVNKTKTEEYTIKRNGQTDWKRCKYLGSLLDTEDIKRRKALAIVTYNKTEKYSGKQVNINGNKNKNSKGLHKKCLPIQFRIVNLDQTTCKGN